MSDSCSIVISNMMIIGAEPNILADFLSSQKLCARSALKVPLPSPLLLFCRLCFKLSGTRKIANAGSVISKKAKIIGGQGPVDAIKAEARAGEMRFPTILAPWIRMKLADLDHRLSAVPFRTGEREELPLRLWHYINYHTSNGSDEDWIATA